MRGPRQCDHIQTQFDIIKLFHISYHLGPRQYYHIQTQFDNINLLHITVYVVNINVFHVDPLYTHGDTYFGNVGEHITEGTDEMLNKKPSRYEVSADSELSIGNVSNASDDVCNGVGTRTVMMFVQILWIEMKKYW